MTPSALPTQTVKNETKIWTPVIPISVLFSGQLLTRSLISDIRDKSCHTTAVFRPICINPTIHWLWQLVITGYYAAHVVVSITTGKTTLHQSNLTQPWKLLQLTIILFWSFCRYNGFLISLIYLSILYSVRLTSEAATLRWEITVLH